ncbi:hypothetical protein TrLO_g15042 [Triparma laevis f. longispina]|uniref:t-SNARE coiled-coil homology domain-containing protein n=2 Tax=Triparma laevis TaxID=1534972 RepID=A0A9W6ZVN1_9STRA|nr:hypothetical protein TrLO_g15042 [Triparma laevis f. longispina]
MPRKSAESKYRKLPTYEDSQDSDDDIMSAVRSQQEMLTHQDESLDVLGQSAARLGMISLEISDELQAQNKMLDEMGEDLDQADINLEIVTRKTKELIKKSGGCKYFSIIVVLSLVVAILFFLIVYT